VRKPKDSNFRISPRKPSQNAVPVQFLGCQNQVKKLTLLFGVVLLRGQQICGNDHCNLIGDTVCWRCKVIFLNSKNTKPKQSKQYYVIFCGLRMKHVSDLYFLKRCCCDLKAQRKIRVFSGRTSRAGSKILHIKLKCS